MITHTISSKNGGTKAVSLTPLRAIKYQCLECVCWSTHEVKYCTSKLCSFVSVQIWQGTGT